MDIAEYEKVKDLTYQEYCDYLVKKYGPAKGNYFTLSWYKNSAITRTKEGLYIHHRYEDHAIMLGDVNFAKLNPYEWQLAKNLVYCDLLEHLYLHILITEYPAKDKNVAEDVGVGGIINFIVPELNDLYSGWRTKQTWREICHSKVINSKDLYFVLLKRFNNNYIHSGYYNDYWWATSFNEKMHSPEIWNSSKNFKLFDQISELLTTEKGENSNKNSCFDKRKNPSNVQTKSKEKARHIDISDDLDLMYKCFNYLQDSTSLEKKYPKWESDVLQSFCYNLEGEIAELSCAIVANIIADNTRSPCLYYLCMLLARQLIVWRMYLNDDIDSLDVRLHMAQTEGINLLAIEDVLNGIDSDYGDEIIFADDGCYDTANTFYLILAKKYNVSVNKARRGLDDVDIYEPFFNISSLGNLETWSEYAKKYLGVFDNDIHLFTALATLSQPRAMENEEIERKIDKERLSIVKRLLSIAADDFITNTDVRNAKKTISFQEDIVDLGGFELNDLCAADRENYKKLIEMFISKGDKFHESMVQQMYYMYKSTWLCYYIGAVTTTAQIYIAFANWISNSITYDELSDDQYEFTTQMFIARSNFYINYDLSFDTSDYRDKYGKTEATLFKKYYKKICGIQDLDEFSDLILNNDLFPALQENFYFPKTIEFLEDYYDGDESNICVAMHELSILTSGARFDLDPIGNFNTFCLPNLLNALSISAISKLLSDYINSLAAKYKSAGEKKIIEECCAELHEEEEIMSDLIKKGIKPDFERN